MLRFKVGLDQRKTSCTNISTRDTQRQPPFALEHIEHSINADRTYRENVLRASSQPDELCVAIVRPQIRKSEASKVRTSNGLPCACCVPESPSVQCLDVLSAFEEETMDMHASRSRVSYFNGRLGQSLKGINTCLVVCFRNTPVFPLVIRVFSQLHVQQHSLRKRP